MDDSKARATPGFVGIFDHRDVYDNVIGAIWKDEVLFAVDEVVCYGTCRLCGKGYQGRLERRFMGILALAAYS